MSELKRIQEKRPGYDCIYGSCGAGDPPCPGHKGLHAPDGHGIHGEEWVYGIVAGDGLTCLTLVVYTDIFPDTVPLDHSARCGNRCERCGHAAHPRAECSIVSLADTRWAKACACNPDPLKTRRVGVGFALHRRFPTSRDEVLSGSRASTVGGNFECLWCSSHYHKAREFFETHGDPARFEQGGRFWVALRDEWKTRDAEARAMREADGDAVWARCQHCDGTGTVRR